MNDRAFIKEKDVDTDKFELNKVNLLLRVLENITKIFRLMKEVSGTYENIRTPPTYPPLTTLTLYSMKNITKLPN